MFENCENVTVCAAMLYPAVCINDITNKSGMYGKSIKYATSHNMAAPWQDPNTKRFKWTLVYFDMDTQYANFQRNPHCQATKRHLNNK